MGHTVKVDRLLIRTAAGQAGIGNDDGHIARSAPTVTGRTSPIKSHDVVTDTNPRRSRRPAVPYSQSDNPGAREPVPAPGTAGSTRHRILGVHRAECHCERAGRVSLSTTAAWLFGKAWA